MSSYLDRVWRVHVIRVLGDGIDLLHVDRHILQDMSSPQAFAGLAREGRRVCSPELTFAVADHIVSTAPGRGDDTTPGGRELIRALRGSAATSAIRMFDLGDPAQGISHIVAAEQAIALPGLVMVCSDAHTATSGALGAIAWAIGTSEAEHVLATQTIARERPKVMRVRFEGSLPSHVSAKDCVLALIGRIGTRAGHSHAIEFDGVAVRAMSQAARATLCNMAAEAGAAIAYIRPDEITFSYLRGRRYAPTGAAWHEAVQAWRELAAGADGPFDREVTLAVTDLAPQITWGTTPRQVVPVDGRIPEPADAADRLALDYMALVAGVPIEGLPIDTVFIGSCTNGRLEDLRDAAGVLRNRKVAAGIRAFAVPGSGPIRRAAEAEGLDRVFTASGFEWREPGCSMCAGLNPDTLAPGERCVSTANRNVEGRPGPGARVHLASPASAAAAAIAGKIVDVRRSAG